MKRPSIGGELSYEVEKNSRTYNGTTSEESSHKFTESIGLKTSGWVYHPALMTYSLMIEPEWEQTKEQNNSGGSSDSSSFSPDYSFSATFLETKPYTLNIFGIRQQESQWANFTGNSEYIVDSYGANAQLKNKLLPTSFGYSHSESEQSGFYSSQNINDNFNLSSQHQTTKSKTYLRSSYSEDQITREGFENQSKTLNNSLNNNYTLTDEKNITLDSYLNYYTRESSWYDTQNINLREYLNWRHNPKLQSNYSASHSRQESDDFNSDITELGAGLTHLLYENLTTNVGSRAQQFIYTDEKENAATGFLNFSYSRPLSWTTLGLHSGWNYLYTQRDSSSSNKALVIDESHILTLTKEIYLNNYNVDLDSIIVTSTDGTIVYIKNIDYTVREDANGYVLISRLPLGDIADGQSVSISYRYLRDAEYDDARLTENYGFNFDLWQDWRFSYDFTRVTQDILSGQPPRNLADDTTHRADIKYDIGWSNTSLTYEENNRYTSSYTQHLIQETLYYRSQLQYYVSLRGYFGQTDYKDRDETRDFYGGITTFDWMLSRWCNLSLEGFYDKTRSDFEETENNGLKASLEFRYRIWTARFSYQFTDQNYITSNTQRKEQLARVEFIRVMW